MLREIRDIQSSSNTEKGRFSPNLFVLSLQGVSEGLERKAATIEVVHGLAIEKDHNLLSAATIKILSYFVQQKIIGKTWCKKYVLSFSDTHSNSKLKIRNNLLTTHFLF